MEANHRFAAPRDVAKGGPKMDEMTPATDAAPTEAPIEEEALIEEVSIDGMCGVY